MKRCWMSKPVIHIFDLDLTITRFPTYTPFLIGAATARTRWRWALIPFLIPFLVGYAMKLVDRKLLKQTMHALMLGRRVARDDIERVAGIFAQRLTRDGMFDDICDIIGTAQSAGERVMIATASHRFYVEAIARALRITDIIATRSIWHADMLTHEIAGENCYADAKLRMISAHFAEHKIDRDRYHVRFYSDHISDLPSFEWSDEPVTKNASPALHALAAERGWRMLN
jgi:HAD superfamily hydrolase (TIGR01490 family)